MTPSEKAELALRMVREDPLIAYDTETSGVVWQKNFPVGYVVTNEQHSVYIPVRHGGGGNLPGAKILPEESEGEWDIHPFEMELAKAFDDRRRLNYRTVGHNLKFDCHFSANAGIMLGRNLSCTQNTECLLDEYAKSFSLSSCASRHKVEAKKGEPMYEHLASLFGGSPVQSQMGNYWKTSGTDKMAVEYAEGDGTSTFQLYHAQLKGVTAPDRNGRTLETVFQLENDLIWTLFRMERKGIKVDVEYLEELRVEIKKKVKEASEALPKDLNLRSPVQMREYVEKVAGRTDWPKTGKGNPSFTEKYLSTFPEGKLIVDLRKWTNLDNSFISPLLENHVHNGRVHTQFNQNKADDYGTISGRLSSSHPNMQQIPKHNKELGKLFRRGFVADEGYVFYEADWSQAEPRLFTHYSREPVLVEGYSSDPPRDMHQVVADMFQKDRGTTAKRMNMGMLTGMYPKSFAGHMDLPLDEATELWERWFKLFPGIKDFQDMAKKVIMSRGHVTTLLGRRGRMENRRLAYKAVSKIIQGGQADMAKYKLIEIDTYLEQEEGDIAHLLAAVHDSFVGQYPEDDSKIISNVLKILEDVQGPPFNLLVPFKADFGKGDNWAEATYG